MLKTKYKYIMEYVLFVISAVVNTLLYIASFFSFLFFIASLDVVDLQIAETLKYFLIGFGCLFFGTVLYDCNVLLWNKIFKQEDESQ